MIITIIRDFLDFSFRVVYIYDCVRFWTQCAVLAQSVAHRLGKAEVGGSSPLDSFEPFPATPVFTRNSEACGVSFLFSWGFHGARYKIFIAFNCSFRLLSNFCVTCR